MPDLDAKTTALVLVDLQNGIIHGPRAPHSGEDVLARGRHLAEAFRAAGALVVLVRVGFAGDFSDAPSRAVDEPMQLPPGGLPEDWSRLADGLAQPADIIVTKRQWGAFYGTDLDLQLRRRGVRTIVVGGIATNFGVESTVRCGWEHGYDVVVIEDACTTHSAEMHEFAIRYIFPRLGRIATSDAVRLSSAA